MRYSGAIFLTQGRGKHTAHIQVSEIMVYYPFHAFSGKKIPTCGLKQHREEKHYIIIQPDGTKTYLPVWMTEPAAKSIPIVEKPKISLEALLELKKIVDAARKSDHHESEIKHDGRVNATVTRDTAGTISKKDLNKVIRGNKEAGKDAFI